MPLDIDCWTMFCDDIRHEADGRISLMGVYRGANSLEEFPSEFPKLCFLVTIRYALLGDLSRISPPEDPVAILIDLNGTEIFSRDMPPPSVEHVRKEITDMLAEGEENKKRGDPFARHLIFSTSIIMTPFEITEPSHLNVRVKIGRKMFRAGGLHFRQKSPLDPPERHA